MDATRLVADVTEYYLDSGDFNGLPASAILTKHGLSLDKLRASLIQLVQSEALSLNFGTVHVNPHIRAFSDISIAEQLDLLAKATDPQFVVYPTPRTLGDYVNAADFEGSPFRLRLARGEPQLSFVSFDLAVLDSYRRDPRYRFWTDDIQARLSIGDEAYQSAEFPEKHKVLLQHFGFSYDPDGVRAVAVFLRDLAGLTPEHQQIWNAWTVNGDYKFHPDYYKSAILADWGLGISLRDAFIVELLTINKMCAVIGWEPLFREIPKETPPALSFLLRPTGQEFGEFVLIADKLLSENINKDFFPKDITRDTKEIQADGTVILKPKGTLMMLEEWVRKYFRLKDDPKVLDDLFLALREVRRLRQQPAHSLKPNEYDNSFFREQRELFSRAYNALRILRMMMANHPATAPVTKAMDRRVYDGTIWHM